LRQSGFVIDQKLPAIVYEFVEEIARRRESTEVEPGAGFRALGMLLNRNGASMTLRRWRQLVRMTSAVKEFADQTGITTPEIGRLERPTSVVFGSESHCLPTMRGLETALGHCHSMAIPDAGHYFPVLNPDIFIQAVGGFAARYDG
jgi:pimeloyl-ACP methyl ester carboxylesterase